MVLKTNPLPFSFTFANATLASQRSQFELQFNQLQNSLINQHNEKIDKITTTPLSVKREIQDLKDRQQSLIESLPALQSFREGNLNTYGTLESLFDDITALFETYNSDGNVDADEVAAFEAQRDLVADKIENLYVFSHPDINDAQVIQHLKDDVDSIRALELTVGTLADNSDVSDTLTALQTEVSVALTVTQNTISTTLDLEQKIQGDFAAVDADLIELTGDEQKRREQKIADAEAQLGNVLRAISLSFEINSGLSEALTNRLKPQAPPPGSAVNIIS